MSDFNYVYGIDLAKLSFSNYGEDCPDKPPVYKTVSRTKLLKEVANRPVGLAGLEACRAAHYRCSELRRLGYEALSNTIRYPSATTNA